MSDLKAGPVRLDRTIEELNESEISPSDRVQLQRFEVVLRAGRRRGGFGLAPEGLEERLFDFAMPQLADPRIMQGERYLALLEELAEAMSRKPADQDKLGRYAAMVLRSELRRHHLLRSYVNALIEA